MIRNNLLPWKNTDPRDIWRDLAFIVYRPIADNGGVKYVCGICQSYDECGTILTPFDDHKTIKSDEKWDDSWIWIELPY